MNSRTHATYAAWSSLSEKSTTAHLSGAEEGGGETLATRGILRLERRHAL
jgi:hypothetical protein